VVFRSPTTTAGTLLKAIDLPRHERDELFVAPAEAFRTERQGWIRMGRKHHDIITGMLKTKPHKPAHLSNDGDLWLHDRRHAKDFHLEDIGTKTMSELGTQRSKFLRPGFGHFPGRQRPGAVLVARTRVPRRIVCSGEER
jgi:hypothetical protein